MSENVEYHKFPRGEHCDEEGCRSKQYYIDSGHQFCRRGHIQAQFTQTQQDEDDWNTQGKKTRRSREKKEKIPTVYNGQKARDLFIQCYQLILWKQVHWLVQEKGLPANLETIVRDLWSFRLRELMPDDSDEESSKGRKRSNSSDDMGIGTGTDDGSDTSAISGKGNDLAGLKLIDSLSLCYLGMVLLRVPISVGQLHDFARREEIVYFRAIRFIPNDMKSHLPPSYHHKLDTSSALQPGQLQKSISLLTKLYSVKFGIELPALNTPVLLFYYVKNLMLPLDVYHTVQSLAKILKIEFTFSRDRIVRASSHPEAKLAALVVMATKLNHPFDDIPRYPKKADGLGSMAVDWTVWNDVMTPKKFDGLKRGEEVDVDSERVKTMSDKQLDDYFDWYENTFIDKTKPSEISQEILNMFPLTPRMTERESEKEETFAELSEKIKRIQSTLRVRKPITDEEAEKLGGVYRHGDLYQAYGSIQDVPDISKAFYQKTAELAGMHIDTLALAVYQIEMKGEGVVNALRREQIFGGQ